MVKNEEIVKLQSVCVAKGVFKSRYIRHDVILSYDFQLVVIYYSKLTHLNSVILLFFFPKKRNK